MAFYVENRVGRCRRATDGVLLRRGIWPSPDECARTNELAAAKAKISEIMKEFGLTVADLGGVAKAKDAKVRQPVVPQFRNAETGEELTGRGRAPRWLDGKDKEQFRIKS